MLIPKIKICGVTTPEQADAIAELDIAYMGIVFHPLSTRFVEVKVANVIASIARSHRVEPVAIFVNHSLHDMVGICEQTGISTVQLHGVLAKEYGRELPEAISRIYALEVNEEGYIHPSNTKYLPDINQQRDKVLLDGIAPGSGKLFAWELFKSYATNQTLLDTFSFFIAGGLSIHTIPAAIECFQPFGIDVSTGVEIAPGQKSIPLIKQVISTVKKESVYA